MNKEAQREQEGSSLLPAVGGIGLGAIGLHTLDSASSKEKMLAEIQRVSDFAHKKNPVSPWARYGDLGKGNLKDALGKSGKSILPHMRGAYGLLGAGALAGGGYLLNKAYNNAGD